MHDAANLERARTQYRQERRTINHLGQAHTQVVVVDLAQRFEGVTTATGGGYRWKIGVASLAAARE